MLFDVFKHTTFFDEWYTTKPNDFCYQTLLAYLHKQGFTSAVLHIDPYSIKIEMDDQEYMFFVLRYPCIEY